jgi:hypothetical protein
MCLGGSQYFSAAGLDCDLSFFSLNHKLLSNHYFYLAEDHFQGFDFLRDSIETRTSIFFGNVHYHSIQFKLSEIFQMDIHPLLRHSSNRFHS